MKTRKLLALSLIVVACISLIGCSGTSGIGKGDVEVLKEIGNMTVPFVEVDIDKNDIQTNHPFNDNGFVIDGDDSMDPAFVINGDYESIDPGFIIEPAEPLDPGFMIMPEEEDASKDISNNQQVSDKWHYLMGYD